MVVWWVVLVGAACGVLPAARLTRPAWAAVALFGAFLVWSAIASAWSLSSESSLAEVSRLAAYLGVLILALVSYRRPPARPRHVVGAVAVAIAVLAALALISRLRPGTFAGASTTATLLPGAEGRLSWPLNYWNALAAMVALGLPLLLAIATSARRLAVQALAAAAIPMIALTGYLTFSRGGAIAAAVAVIAFIALAPERIPKLATRSRAAAGSAVLIAGAVHRHAIEQGLTGPVARHQGSTLIVAVILVCAGVAPRAGGRRTGRAPRHAAAAADRCRPPARGRCWRRWSSSRWPSRSPCTCRRGSTTPGTSSSAPRQPASTRTPSGATARSAATGVTPTGRPRSTRLPGHTLRGWGPGRSSSCGFRARRARTTSSTPTRSTSRRCPTLASSAWCCWLRSSSWSLAAAVVRVVHSRSPERTLAAAVAAATLAFLASAASDWVWQEPVLPAAWLLLAAAVLAPAPLLHRAGRRPPATAGTNTRPRTWRVWAPRAAIVLAALGCLVAIGVPARDHQRGPRQPDRGLGPR